MNPFRLYTPTGDAVAHLDSLGAEMVDVSLNLEGRCVMCVSPSPSLAMANDSEMAIITSHCPSYRSL